MEASAAKTFLVEPPHREPSKVRILTGLSLVGVAAILLPNYRQIGLALVQRGPELLLWAILLLMINLFFHFENRSLQFTLDVPILLAASALYEPAVVAALAFVAETDVREVERRVSLPRAIYNRAQIAISAFVASGMFHAVRGTEGSWLVSLLAMSIACTAFYGLNGAFVMALVSIREGVPVHRVVRLLRVGGLLEFLLTYLGYGVFALVLARLFREVGPWSVVLFLVPLLVAHLALVRAERLFALAERLQDRERLLELLSERMVEERKDERMRIASDLHDDVLQDVTRIWMQSRFVSQSVAGESQLASDVRQLMHDAEATLSSLRGVISDLKRSPLGRGGLVATVDQLVRDLRLDWGKRIEFQRPLDDLEDVSSEIQLVAYQVVREGLVNALKHSQAPKVGIRVGQQRGILDVRVRDCGVGFVPQEVDTSVHFGLGLIEERVRMVGGTLTIDSRKGEGTTLWATLPMGGRDRRA